MTEFCQAHYESNERDRKALVRRGIYLPLLFDGDCMLNDFILRFPPLMEQPPILPIEDGWIELPSLGDFFEEDEDG